ncbi:SLC13 family permease [Blattabacterium cuenoti]|uniref:SLC13 family permease n=1 Tax=Blattabacterium cuenoti TaxID=1653831 RepID=UPI00163C341E|nr:SLC13 family permease [Blattabacterium cuenoti]
MVILIFIIGYLLIAFGNIIFLNKIIPSILMAIITWSLIIYFNIPVYELVNNLLIKKKSYDLLLIHLGKASEIIFFIIGAMAIILVIENFFAFEALKELLYTKSKRKLLWKLSIISFFLSAIIDNLTTTIVLISLLRKIIPNYKERLYYLGIIIIAANAGGVWSPIGDITTTMLWISKKVTTFLLIKKLFIPSIICMAISTFIGSYIPIFRGNIHYVKNNNLSKENIKIGFFMLKLGLILMLLVPIYKNIIGIPPYMGIMLSFGILLLICTIIYKKKFKNCIDDILKKIDFSSILFFFGILLSISSLESLGILYKFSNWIKYSFPTWKITALLFGFISSIIDNVPLVAATIAMFSSFKIDNDLWHFMAYVSGTGGSLFIIGSASGVTAMGMEKIDFIWYLKKISWIALIGYIFGYIYLIL